jgi:hypothetical protein
MPLDHLRPLRLALLLLGLGSPLYAQGPSAPEVIAAYRRLSAQPPWPGFEPATVPVAVFDGESTWLWGHPHPPTDTFRTSIVGLYRMAGQHPLVKANSSAELEGVTTATLLLDRSRPGTATSWAATLIHEAFHVYQRTHHKDWTANEAELFTYPVEAEAPQRLQRLETEAWHRAVSRQQSACWAQAALEYRQLRFGLLPVGAVSYERGTELNEGLATYVEFRAEKRDTIPFPMDGFAPEEMRLRGYTVGPTIGRLLDRFAPHWREQLERGPTRALDELLAAALGASEGCRFGTAEEDSIRALARLDVRRVHASREVLRDSVLSAPGWRIEVTADSGVALWPERFDPLNVVALEGGAIVHRRFLKLSKNGLAIEVLNRTALTESAGEHPLFNGIRRLVVSGLPGEPSVEEQPGHVVVTADGVRLEGRVRAVERNGQTILLKAGP